MSPTQQSVTPEDKSVKQQSPKPNQPSFAANATPLVQQESMDISRLQPNQVLSLQRSIGNRAVQNLISSSRTGSHSGPVIQAKLEVGPAGDRYEQEADRIAAQVVKGSSTPQANVQREETESIQRDDLEEEEEEGTE